ncbi:hypothetical protein FE783_17790 [Paenibacillus mesophilus]|uniref:hypothetical protein n=1 Tax=Paenibacillus mesophilus TaxID=2582849 RepID=UPI00110DEDAC|nr:hypothetical protein [Paenibacillus mesophilus]TMV48370.1 hypothetical protein FE783_17790 [Paenibacillus mesophilus]
MNIFDLLKQWKESQTIIELHYIHAGAKKIAHGRIYSFDLGQQNILFYNEDKKSVDNISLAQIEDAISAFATRPEADKAAANPTGKQSAEADTSKQAGQKKPRSQGRNRASDRRAEHPGSVCVIPDDYASG